MDTQNQVASVHTNHGGSSSTEINSCYSGSTDDDNSEAHSSSESETTFSYKNLSRKQKYILASLCATSFIIMMSESIMSPLYPEETALRGISTVLSGWVFAAYALGQVIFSPIIGKLLPKIGARFVYLAGVFFAGGCTLLFGILDFIPEQDGKTIFVVFCFIMQIVLSMGVTAQQTATFSMASQEFGTFFTAVFALTEVFVGLGMTVGPAIGGFLYTLGGFHLPFVVVGVLIISSIPFNYFLIPSSHEGSEQERRALLSTNDEVNSEKKPNRKSATRMILGDPTALITLFSVALGAGNWAVLDPILEPRLTDFGLTPELSGVIFLILSASYAVSSPISSWASLKLADNRIIMIPGFAVCGLSHLLLGGSPILGFDPDYREIWLTILSLIVLGIAISMAIIPSYEIILDVSTSRGLEDNLETNGAVAGIWCAMYAVGDFVGPIYGGWMVENGGFALTLTYSGLACLLCAVLLTISALYDKKCRKPKNWSGEEEDLKTRSEYKLLQYTDEDFVTFSNVYIKSFLPPRIFD